jgi:hypothetical protein
MTITEEEYGFNNDIIEVVAPSGAIFPVLNEDERAYFEDVSARYLADNHFNNITDLQDLDRIINMELLCYRWNIWLSREMDYEGQGIDQEKILKFVNDFSKEIRLIKKQLGIDKSSRDKDKGESIAKYIDNLRIRAKEFGVYRNEQSVKAITLFKELQSLVILNKNCTPEERRENRDIRAEVDDIFDWLINVAIPEMEEIELAFRENQKMWVRDQ